MDTHLNKDRIIQSPIISIGTDDVRKRMGEILDCVNLRGDEFLIERKHKPLAMLIPVQKHHILKKLAQAFLMKGMIGKRDISQKEADTIADEAKHSSRKK